MRRVLAPLGGAISFVAVALLVIGGLAWVTVEALNVEDERRAATARANASQVERLALWKLDSRLFPAWGVENNRQYVHYFAFHAPYQAVVNAGASSPQLSSPLLCTDTLPGWMVLHFQLDPQRGWDSPQVMPLEGDVELRNKLLELLALIPDEINESRTEALNELRAKFDKKICHDQLMRLEALSPEDSSLGGVPYLFDTNPKNNVQPLPQGNVVGSNTRNRWYGYQVESKAQELQKLSVEAQTGDRGGQAGGAPAPGAPGGLSSQQTRTTPGQTVAQNNDFELRDAMNKKTVGGGRGETVGPAQPATAPVTPPLPEPKVEDPKKAEPTGKDDDKADKKVIEEEKPEAKPSDPKPTAPRSGSASPNPPAPREAGKQDGVAKDGAVKEQWFGGEARLAADTPRPGLAQPENRKIVPPVGRPPTVQLGPMRPVWLKADNGDEALILVRTARLENKTVFQGVLLDWPRLQAELIEDIKLQMPEAKLVRVANGADPSERRMTALPAVLEPGPDPAPPPAGWTPLRIGLTLGWVAALFALAAAGFVGWTLIDLSERRIRFVSAVTHELRTPLTSLRLSTDLLSTGMISDEEQQKQYLRTMGHESERLNVLIENVLDFAKLEKRTVQATCAPVPVKDLLESVQSTWAERLTAEGRQLVVMSTLPADQICCTDARIAAQILGNLIDNARKYTREAEDKRIWLWARPGEKNRLLLEVEDRGPGVPAAERAFIFRPFRRGKNVTATGGAGLGLALAKQWADLLGGRISYSPAEGGVGACFRLDLPCG